MAPLRILLVDDSALFRTLLRNALTELPDCVIVGTANDGVQAIAQCLSLKPDVVTLDIEMPGMDGLEVLQRIRQAGLATQVIMISRLTSAGAQITTDALLQGAFDFILKPQGKNPADNKSQLVAALAEKMNAVRDAQQATYSPNANQSTLLNGTAAPSPNRVKTSIDCVIIGSSTGGPDALAQILPYLPADLAVPIIVVQHMPEGFIGSLAKRLDEASEIEVVEAQNGMRLINGSALLAPSGKHLRLWTGPDKTVRVELTSAPKEHNCRPAIDYTLRSAVEIYGNRLLCLILTGMGRDGTEGCRLASEKGALVMAQAPEGCTVFGMPKAVIEAGLSNQIVPVTEIAKAIVNAVRN